MEIPRMNHAEDRHDPANDRRHRLGQLLDLAQNYRGWTRKQLSAELGRDPTKLVPGSGVPKLDVIIALAKTLDWTLMMWSSLVAGRSADQRTQFRWRL